MPDAYQALTTRQQRELLDDVSRRTGLAPVILEKDYWVCRTLGVLFQLQDIGPHLVFKGGTSLSKVYRIIDRFSEDIDVSFHREFLGFSDAEHDPEAAKSNKETGRRLDALKQACIDCVRQVLIPALQIALEAELEGGEGWSLEIDPGDPQTILFYYPRAGATPVAYIPESVRIELGARSDHWPSESHSIQSYIGEELNQSIGYAAVRVLAAERTFWEKATLLHAECHRPPDSPMPQRYTRHFHDLARLARSPIAGRALEDAALRKRVVEHKSIYFRSGWARYDSAVPGSFRLIPDASRLTELERDHASMEIMFFKSPPPISEVLATLRDLENRINSLSA
jgi:hypothetical protein